MFARRRLSLLACLLLGASACAGGGGDPVQELCELTLTCECSMPPYATVEACVTDLNTKADGLKDLATTNSVTFEQRCLDRLLGQYHDEIGCGIDVPEISSSCSYCALVHGDKAVGEACTDIGDFSDCDVGFFCDNGKCKDPCARLAEGTACMSVEGGASELLGICADGLFCDYTSPAKACAARVDAGGACTIEDACKDGLVCAANTCVAEPAAGEACVISCAGELVCDESICVAPPGEGAACTNIGQCASGLKCEEATCVALEPLLCGLFVDE